MSRRALVIENDRDNAALVRLVLRSAGCAVRWVRDLGAARSALGSRPPHLVILELRHVGGSGLDFCREVKARWPSLPVIVLTTDTAAHDEALAAGADLFVPKPFDVDRLEGDVKGLLLASGRPGRPRRA